MEKIFVSIASYRDPETIPTILDAKNKAKYPDNIRFGLCLQHEPGETDLSVIKNTNTDTIEYNWRESQGTCWARHNIQKQLYDGENYYFQLDSHHRFCPEWDDKLINLINSLKEKYEKPIIGGYCPGYKPSDDNLEDAPMKINSYPDFTTQGDLMFYPKVIKDFKTLRESNTSVISARFLSGHFIFVDGIFCKECLYDPNLYFRGEELSLSARAFTKGYDFFHPTESIVWHEYIRKGKTKHWDDHIVNNGFILTATNRSEKAKTRVRHLLGMEENNTIFGNYGLGNKRSLHDYELYAGLNLKTRQIHKYAYDIKNKYPHAFNMSESEWSSGLMEKYKIKFFVDSNVIDNIKKDKNITTVALIFETKFGSPVYRKDIKDKEIQLLKDNFYIESSMDEKPSRISILTFAADKTTINKTVISNMVIS